jgi:uncharacterized protein YoxC
MSDERLARIEDKLDGLTGSVAGLTGSVDGLEGRMTGLTGKVDGLEGQMTGLTGKVDGLEGQMTGLTGKVDGLEGQLDGLASSVADLTIAVDDLKGGQNALQQDVAELQAGQLVGFAGLDARVGRVETNLLAVSARLGVDLERTKDHVTLLAEGHGGIIQQMDRRFEEQRSDIQEIIAPLVLAIGAHTQELDASRRIPSADGRPARRRATRTRRRRA